MQPKTNERKFLSALGEVYRKYNLNRMHAFQFSNVAYEMYAILVPVSSRDDREAFRNEVLDLCNRHEIGWLEVEPVKYFSAGGLFVLTSLKPLVFGSDDAMATEPTTPPTTLTTVG